MKIKLALLALIQVWTMSEAAALSKSTQFIQEFTLRSDYVYPVWLVRDAAFIVFNPSSSTLTVEATVEAVNNPSFVFVGGNTGTFTFPQLSVKRYQDCQTHTGFLGYSFFGFAIPNEMLFGTQTFRLTVTSTSGQSFYLYGPQDGFIAETGSASTWTSAYRAGWQAFNKYIPVQWDSSIQRWIVPWVDMWHRTSDYRRGWQSTVQFILYNTGPIPEPSAPSYSHVIYNQNQTGGSHGHDLTKPIPGQGGCQTPTSSCGLCDKNHTFTTMSRTVSQFEINGPPIDVYRFHIEDHDARSQHDGQLAISGKLSFEVVYARVFPISDGTVCATCQ